MTRVCSYPQCAHRQPIRDKNAPKCKMHVFPANRRVCQDWLDACHFKVSPTNIPAALYICSCHFAGGRGPTSDNPKPFPYVVRIDFGVPLNEAEAANLQKRFQPSTRASLVETMEISIDPFETFFDENNSDERDPAQLESTVSDRVNVQNNLPSQVFCPPSEPKKFYEVAQPSSTNNLSLSSFQQKSANTTSTIGVELEVENSRRIFLAIPLRLTQAIEEAPANRTNQVSLKGELPQDKVADSTGKKKEERPSVRDVGVQCDLAVFSYESSICKWSESDFEYMTGISRASFEALFKFLGGDEACSQLNYRYDENTPVREIYLSHSPREGLFITLVRLRRGYSLREMNLMFGLKRSQISAIFFTWVKYLAIKFQSLEKFMFANVASLLEDKPDCYKQFPNLRCAIGTTVIKIQSSADKGHEDSMDCEYEDYDSVKFLIATSALGGLSFISEGIGENVPDGKLFMKSGIFQYLQPGEAVMADRRFHVQSYLEGSDIELITPPALGKRKAFTEKERMICEAVATSQTQVRTFITEMKRFKFIRHVVPNTVLDILPDIVRICACVLNFREPFKRWHIPDSSSTLR